MKNIALFNLSLLGKWRWRLLVEKKALRVRVLIAKYGAGIGANANLGGSGCDGWSSVWWKDLCSLGGGGEGDDWLLDGLRKKIGFGNSVLFWHDIWFAIIHIKEVFLHLYNISLLQNEPVSNFGRWVDSIWIWDFKWRRNFFLWEENQLLEFQNAFAGVTLQ